jgi:hypothetical protein
MTGPTRIHSSGAHDIRFTRFGSMTAILAHVILSLPPTRSAARSVTSNRLLAL